MANVTGLVDNAVVGKLPDVCVLDEIPTAMRRYSFGFIVAVGIAASHARVLLVEALR